MHATVATFKQHLNMRAASVEFRSFVATAWPSMLNRGGDSNHAEPRISEASCSRFSWAASLGNIVPNSFESNLVHSSSERSSPAVQCSDSVLDCSSESLASRSFSSLRSHEWGVLHNKTMHITTDN